MIRSASVHLGNINIGEDIMMRIDDEFVWCVLRHLRDNDYYSVRLLKFNDLPGNLSKNQVDFHLERCEDVGFITYERTLSHSARVSLLPKGLRHINQQG